jgi:hypothetical protein
MSTEIHNDKSAFSGGGNGRADKQRFDLPEDIRLWAEATERPEQAIRYYQLYVDFGFSSEEARQNAEDSLRITSEVQREFAMA